MTKYRVALIERPASWSPASPDDVPQEPGVMLETLGETDDLLGAVRRAVEYNAADESQAACRWAVVVEPGTAGCTWPSARLCTPLRYKVAAIWWPLGWEPQSPLDVPNCVWRARGGVEEQQVSYSQAVAVARGLNQQSIDHASATWYVVLAVENEPLSQTVSYDPSGLETSVQVRRLHVIRPDQGTPGDCSYCPARSYDCAQAEWTSLEQSATTVSKRALDSTNAAPY
ncbi:MAG: hypothetical protein NUV77_19295 [Thermoguttaceae bacterium]|jgi:hypothetical protein|nr:hypothetical protein [Thermoguttaceae bacterium]